MALLNHRQTFVYNDDYRAFLIKQNDPPIVHDIKGKHLKRISALGRTIFSKFAGWGSALYAAMRNAEYRRVQREWMWYGIPCSHLLENDEQTESSDTADSTPRKLS
ncbi:MAG TPA: hypothetical protein VGC86_11250 [Afipia sp.]